MPDTEANQAEYPQSRSQKTGLGLPIAPHSRDHQLGRGDSAGGCHGPVSGQTSSELGLFREISGQLQPGDIALADRFFCNYWVIADSLRRASTSSFGCTRLVRPTSAGDVDWGWMITS